VSPKPIANIDDPRYVKALAHPLRVRILAILEERPASPVELSRMLGSSLGVVSYHVRTLFDLGLLKLVRTTQRRGAIEHHYRAKERPRVSDDAWATASTVAKQAFISATLQQMFQYVQQSAAIGGFDRPEAHASRTALRLDEKGWKELTQATTKFLERVEKIEEAAGARLRRDPHDPGFRDVGVALLAFDALPFSETPPPTADEAERTSAAAAQRRGRARA
jgi:DNA-binding transcriptional ArsR family regulator